MSDQNDLQTNTDAEFVVEDSETAAAPRRGNGVAWLALLLSMIAVVAIAYVIFDDWRSGSDSSELDNQASIRDLQQQLSESGAALATLESSVGQITHPDYSGDIAAVRSDVDDQLRLLDSLPSRMSTIESSVASLAGISAGARETFLLAEAEYYLQIGNAQLQLANNPRLASLALGMADERVTQLSDPSLTAVRRAISNELAALEVMEKPDLEGASLTLASLARVVESLPITRASNDETIAEDGAELGGMDRAWNSVKGAMSGLVKVTPPDQAKLALISPDGELFLRNNIALQLQAARLALLRGEQTIFEQTLDDASALLTTYFDTSSAQVQSAQQTIAEIRGGVFTVAAPDISDSLRLLRDYRSLRETSE